MILRKRFVVVLTLCVLMLLCAIPSLFIEQVSADSEKVRFVEIVEGQNNDIWEETESMYALYIRFSGELCDINHETKILSYNELSVASGVTVNGEKITSWAFLWVSDLYESSDSTILMFLIPEDSVKNIYPTKTRHITTFKIEEGTQISGGATFAELNLYLGDDKKWSAEYPEVKEEYYESFTEVVNNNVDVGDDKVMFSLRYTGNLGFIWNDEQDRKNEDGIGQGIVIDGVMIKDIEGASVSVSKETPDVIDIILPKSILAENTRFHLSADSEILGTKLSSADFFISGGKWYTEDDIHDVVFEKIEVNSKKQTNSVGNTEYLTSLVFANQDETESVFSGGYISSTDLMKCGVYTYIYVNDKPANKLSGVKITISGDTGNTINVVLPENLLSGTETVKLTIKSNLTVGVGILKDDVTLYFGDNGKWFTGSPAVITYTVDGSFYYTSYSEIGGNVTFPKDPEKENYNFKGWLLDFENYDRTEQKVTGDITLDASFLKIFKVTFESEGVVLQETYEEMGAVPKYEGEIPVKEQTVQYTYDFTGWDKKISQVAEDAVYTAQFTETVRKYKVTINVEGKEEIQYVEYYSNVDLTPYVRDDVTWQVTDGEGNALQSLTITSDKTINIVYEEKEEEPEEDKKCSSVLSINAIFGAALLFALKRKLSK